MPRGKRPSVQVPIPTGDATARYERFNASGTTWYDTAASPANGTLSGDDSWWPNFVTGSSYYVAIGNPTKLDFAGAHSFVVWAYQNADPPIQSGEYLIGKDKLGVGRNTGLSMQDNNALMSGFRFAPFRAVQYTPPIKNRMFFIVYVNEGTGGDLKLYVDGELESTAAGDGLDLTWTATVPWEIGRRQDDTDYFTGQIKTVRFYNRALSADEIKRDYYAGLQAHPKPA